MWDVSASLKTFNVGDYLKPCPLILPIKNYKNLCRTMLKLYLSWFERKVVNSDFFFGAGHIEQWAGGASEIVQLDFEGSRILLNSSGVG